MRFRGTHHSVVIAMLMLALWFLGCADAHPQGYGYVFYKGGPDAIADWTLHQEDSIRIVHGFSALS
jgi:hypothetical protein